MTGLKYCYQKPERAASFCLQDTRLSTEGQTVDVIFVHLHPLKGPTYGGKEPLDPKKGGK